MIFDLMPPSDDKSKIITENLRNRPLGPPRGCTDNDATRHAAASVQLPVGTTPAFSIISTAVRMGATGRCSIPAGTENACRGPSSTVSAS
jgi:hypothetical protein